MRRVIVAAMFAGPAYLGLAGYCADLGLYGAAGGIALGLLPLVVATAEWLQGSE